MTALRAEIKRLQKIVREQGAEKRRLTKAYARLKDEKRSSHELISVAEQLQDEIERLEREVERLSDGPLKQAAECAKRSREALSVRYGHLHRALAALVAAVDENSRKGANDLCLFEPVLDAEQALRDVDDPKWARAQLAATRGSSLSEEEA